MGAESVFLFRPDAELSPPVAPAKLPKRHSRLSHESWLESLGGPGIVRGMTTVADIEQAMEKLAPEQWVEIRRWIDRRAPRPANAGSPVHPLPDFIARQKAIFGERVLADSQTVLDDLRADRR